MSETEAENSLLPPSLRDRTSLDAVTRHGGFNLRSISQGFHGGRFVPAHLIYGDSDEADDAVQGEGTAADDATHAWQWDDRHFVTGGGSQTATLTYEPVPESLFVRWHPDGGAGIPLTNEQFTLDGQTVSIPTTGVQSTNDFFSFQYEFEPGIVLGEPDDVEVFLRGTIESDNNALTQLPLPTTPDPTEVGDFLALGIGTFTVTATPGDGTTTDPRMTALAHGVYYGNATDLTDLDVSATSRVAYQLASFVGPLAYLNHDSVGPSAGTLTQMVCPQVAARAAILIVVHDCPNGLGNTIDAVPAGWVLADQIQGTDAVCGAGIWYWDDPDATNSPAGNIDYSIQFQGFAYATVIGLQRG